MAHANEPVVCGRTWPTREFHEIHSKICREETNGEISLKFALREMQPTTKDAEMNDRGRQKTGER